MSSLSFISLILLLTADTYFGEYLVCTPCAVVDNEVFVLFRSRYFYRDTLFADCIRGKQHEFDVQLLGTCKHNLAERWRSGFLVVSSGPIVFILLPASHIERPASLARRTVSLRCQH